MLPFHWPKHSFSLRHPCMYVKPPSPSSSLLPPCRNTFTAVHIHLIHRNPEVFPQPDRFLPDRWLPAGRTALGPADPSYYAPFGTGARMCVGYKLASMVSFERSLFFGKYWYQFTVIAVCSYRPVHASIVSI